MTSKLKRGVLAACVAGMFAAAPVQAALILTDAFNGNWKDANRANRGWDVDVLTRANGDKIVFLYTATYDQAGNPFWMATSFDIKEFEFAKTNVPLMVYEGATFNGSETPASRRIGTLDIDFASCGEIKVAVKPDASSGFSAVDATLNPLQFLVTPGMKSPSCVYTRKFAGCPAGSVASARPRTCELSGSITRDMTLTNDTTWVLNGLVKVGGDNAQKTVLTIEPGTLLTGNGVTSDYLYVQPGSRLIADGKAYAPIIFSSPDDGVSSGREPAPKDWGGVVLSGNAPNNKCPSAPFDCRSEFDPNLRYSGNNPHDSSGILRYVQVRYSGYVFAEGREVNAFTFQSVGDGTVLEHLQAYRGGDDGFEWFGGTVNARNLVVTEGGDDGLDWDEGWSGKVQFALLQNGLGFGEDNGIEASNQAVNHDASPRATPTIANITFIGNGSGGDGIQLKEGSAGHLVNALVSGFDKSGKACLALSHAATEAVSKTPALSIDHSFLNCATPFRGANGVTDATTRAWFEAGNGNSTSNAMLNGFLPAAGSPLMDGGRLIDDAFFAPAPYVGAFRNANDDWTLGWTHNIPR